MDETAPRVGLPAIYNLFPRLAGSFDRWPEHFGRASAMGFDWVYLNPVFYPGFSGSLYAVKDFRRLDPMILPGDASQGGLDELRPVLDAARQAGLRPMVDLVINHTAKDSELVDTHPEWYRRDESGQVESPWAIDPADARRKTVWGDLAELDFEGTEDPEGLEAYVTEVALACLEAGFEGFRCDAAYKVPTPIWRRLSAEVRQRSAGALFVAETLGCRPEEMLALEGAGFDLVMNSSKYWAFDAPWCLEQHEQWQRVAPSVSFPESHDTPRLAADSGGLVQVQQQRLAFAAFFSTGILVPMGYELGFRGPLDVVQTRPDHWEEPLFDLQDFIRDVLTLKRQSPALAAEGHHTARSPLDQSTLMLEKRHGDDVALLLINKDWHAAQEVDPRPALEGWTGGGASLARPFAGNASSSPLPEGPIRLEPAEIAVVVPE